MDKNNDAYVFYFRRPVMYLGNLWEQHANSILYLFVTEKCWDYIPLPYHTYVHH